LDIDAWVVVVVAFLVCLEWLSEVSGVAGVKYNLVKAFINNTML
jgi:hypothetical protein